MDIQQGTSDGVNLDGTRAVMVLDLPGDFFSGNATARLYIDEAASPHQRQELEAILTGKKGGVFEALAGAFTKVLPTQYVRITVQEGDNPSITIGNVGEIKLQPVKTEDGRPARIVNAPALAAFGFESEDIALSHGTWWGDPEMRRWVGGGNGGMTPFHWSA